MVYLKGELLENLREKWDNIPKEAFFFISSCSHSCFSLRFSKQKAKKYKRMELNTRAKLEIAITNLHEDIYNKQKKGNVNQLRWTIE